MVRRGRPNVTRTITGTGASGGLTPTAGGAKGRTGTIAVTESTTLGTGRSVRASWATLANSGQGTITADRATNVAPPLAGGTIELRTATIGSMWRDSTNVDWCVLVEASSPTGGVGNALIITRQVHGSASIVIIPNQFVPFEDSTLRTNMTNWYNGALVSDALRNIGLNYTFPNPLNTSQNLTLA